jgi:hypothetical protein
MTSSFVWYQGFDAMGSLANTGVSLYDNCVTQGHAPFSKELTDAMDLYVNVFGSAYPNFLTFVNTDNVPLEMLKTAIEKNHSLDPNGIKQVLESMNQTFYGVLSFQFSPTNHFGLTGSSGAAVCQLTPFVDGPYREPVIAS